MTSRTLAVLLALWALATGVACAVVYRTFALALDEAHPRAVIASVWSGGELVERDILARADLTTPALAAALASHAGSTLVYESVVAEGPVWTRSDVAFALSFVAGHDGLAATYRGHTEYLTPDDLLVRQAYDKGIQVASLGLSTGVDVPLALAVLSQRSGATVRDLLDGARFHRFRVVRSTPALPPAHALRPDTMTNGDVRDAALAAGSFLARGVDDEGRFRYLVDAPSNRTLPGYDWPRHAGATYFLAQIAALSGDAPTRDAALRAAGRLRDRATVPCGPYRCIGSDDVVDLGSTALAVIAFVEIARTKLDPRYAALVPPLTAFLRSQQRSDGEFMHLYDREARRSIDVQLLYYSGEAALALARAHALVGDPRDLEAASQAVEHLAGPAWRFFGSRYYFGEEHWTCQAMDDLWDRAPSRSALDFCLRWQSFNRALQYREGETVYDADGAYGFGPVLTPRLTPVASRSEAGIATLDAARRAGISVDELARLENQTRRSIALLLRQQFRPGPRHLLAVPAAIDGAMPGSEVDWQARIDYAQHTGSALLRWLAL